MEKFIIVIVMLFAEPTIKQEYFEVETYEGNPLNFLSIQECYAHVEDNFFHLKLAGEYYFPSAFAVDKILCIDIGKEV
tara:strand:+ start:544 stop:777 length:234 start_codon:yes stop_codon:yes gene_type:complete